jgi:hypothetical protein
MSWLLVALAVAATGCAQPPNAEIDAAQQAEDAARSAGAPDYARESWAKVQDARARLETELEAQKTAFVIGRSYASAKVMAADLKTAAEQATLDAEAGKEAARSEALQSIEQAKALSEEVRELVASAPSGKGSGADLAALQNDAGVTGASLEEAERAYGEGSYLHAKSKADAVYQQLSRIKEEITAANAARRPA